MANDAKYQDTGLTPVPDTVTLGSGRDGYGDCDPNSPSTNSTPVYSSTFLNMTQEEIAEAVVTSGQDLKVIYDTADRDTYSQLAKALAVYSSGAGSYRVATGSANIIVADTQATVGSTVIEPVLFLYDGLEVNFKPIATNTGATSINVDGLTFKDVVRPDGQPLQAADLVANSIAGLTYDIADDNFKLVRPSLNSTMYLDLVSSLITFFQKQQTSAGDPTPIPVIGDFATHNFLKNLDVTDPEDVGKYRATFKLDLDKDTVDLASYTLILGTYPIQADPQPATPSANSFVIAKQVSPSSPFENVTINASFTTNVGVGESVGGWLLVGTSGGLPASIKNVRLDISRESM